MNYTYARDRFKSTPNMPLTRAMIVKKSMMGAGLDARPRIYRGVPRIWHSPEGSTIDRRRQLRREQRNAAARGAGAPALFTPALFTAALFTAALFTAALQRALPRGVARGLAASIKRYSAMFVFSKKARVLAGKR